MSARTLVAVAAMLLAGCSSPIEPPDIAAAEKMCHFRGGMATVERYEGGRTLFIRCKDGAYVELKLRWLVLK